MKFLKPTNISILSLILLLISCAPQKNEDAIKKEITELELQVKDINAQIENLKDQLPVDSLKLESESLIAIEIKALTHEPFYHFFEANGAVEAVQDAFISPQSSGQIKEIYVKEGQRVSKGKLLVSLDTRIIDSSIEELENALELAKKIYNKQKTLWDQNIGSEVQFLEAKNARESLEKKMATLNAQKELALVRAPFSGVVDEIFSKKGELASPGMRLLQLVNLDKIKINANVSEAYLSKIAVGDFVDLNFPACPECDSRLPVSRIGNTVNIENRTFRVEVEMNNTKEKLKPNILSIMKINDYYTDTALVVPSIIVKQDIKGSFLYLAKEHDGSMVAQKTYVEQGISYENNSTIVSGLSIDDKVIVSGYNMLSNGVGVRLLK